MRARVKAAELKAISLIQCKHMIFFILNVKKRTYIRDIKELASEE